MRIDGSNEVFAGQLFEILDITRDESLVKDAKICFADPDPASGRTFYNALRSARDVMDYIRSCAEKSTVILSIKMSDDKWYNFTFLFSALDKPQLISIPDVNLRTKLNQVEDALDDFCAMINSLRRVHQTIDSTLKYI